MERSIDSHKMPQSPLDSSSSSMQAELIHHLSESISAIAAITQSLRALQDQVREHANIIRDSREEILILKERLGTIARLVQGTGVQDSLTGLLVDLQRRIQSMEDGRRIDRDELRHAENASIGKLAVIVAVISILVSAIVSAFLKG